MEQAKNFIVSKARSIGLNVSAIEATMGDGNCFYRAVIESLSLTTRPYLGNHVSLRNEVVSFVNQNKNAEFVISWLETFAEIDPSTLNDNIADQFRNGVYTDELFIRATAIYLNIVILCTKSNSTLAYPYEIFQAVDVSFEDRFAFPGTYIIIGHRNLHFQSLYFLDQYSNISNAISNLSESSNTKCSTKSSLGRLERKFEKLDSILAGLMKSNTNASPVNNIIIRKRSQSETTTNSNLLHIKKGTTKSLIWVNYASPAEHRSLG